MVLMHFKYNPTDVLGLSGLRCRPGADRSLTFAARIRAIPPARDSYPAVETDREIQRGQKIRAANVRERSASHWPRCRCRSGFPAPTLPRALRRWRCGLGCGPQPTPGGPAEGSRLARAERFVWSVATSQKITAAEDAAARSFASRLRMTDC